MSISRNSKLFDYACDFALLIFFPVLVAIGTNEKKIFIPLEIFFIAIFTVKYFVKRSSLSSYTIWSLGLAVLSFVSVFYAPNRVSAMRWAISVAQVVIFGNLMVPYFRDSSRNIHMFLISYLIATFALAVRLWFSAPFHELMSRRLGETIGINANHVGFLFVMGALICLYYLIVEKKWGVIPLFVLFAGLSLFSGSRKAIFILIVGIILISILSIKNPLNAIIVLLVSGLLVAGILFLSLNWEPLRNVLGVRIEKLISVFIDGKGDGSTETRIAMIKLGAEMFLEKPFFGWGLRAFTNVSPFATYSHNNYIEVLVSWGVVGLLWYYGFLIYILIRGILLLFTHNHSKFVVFSVAILLIICMDDFGRVRFFDEVTHFFYALCFAIVASHTPPSGIDVLTLLSKIRQWFGKTRSVESN